MINFQVRENRTALIKKFMWKQIELALFFEDLNPKGIACV